MIQKVLFIFLLCLPIVNYGQGGGYQRMAIPQGVYNIQPYQGERITTYCLNERLKAPNAEISYNNVIGGGNSAYVTIFKPGHPEKVLLEDAIKEGSIEIRGNTLPETPDINIMRRYFRREVVEALLSDHQSLMFKNHTQYPIQLSFEKNIQLGTGNETPEDWIENYKLSNDLATQDNIQKKIWLNQAVKNKRIESAEAERVRARELLASKEKEEKDHQLALAHEREINQKYLERIKVLGYDKNLKGFQQSNGLSNAQGFDNETISKINSIEDIHRNELNQIGIKYINLKGQILEYQGYKKIAKTGILDADTKAFLQKDLKDGIYFHNGKTYKTVSVGKQGEKYIESECSENLLIPLEKIDKYTELMEDMSNRGFLREEAEVLSFVIDRDTELKIKSSFPGQYTEFYSSDISALKKKLKSKSRKSLFIIGHIEDNYFVGKNAKSENVFSIKIWDIEQMAKELGINIFLLGCNSAFASSARNGVGNKFNTIYALERLDQALNSSQDVCGLLGNLASEDLKILLENNPLQDLEYVTAKMARSNRAKGGIATTAAILGGVGVIALLYGSKDKKKAQKNKKQ